MILSLIVFHPFHSEKLWFEETDPTGRYTIEAKKIEPDSPGGLYANTDVNINIKDSRNNCIVQSFSTSVTVAEKETYCVEYDDKGMTLLLKNDHGVIEGSFYFSYDSLSKLNCTRGDNDD